jgi:hypothetical protein
MIHSTDRNTSGSEKSFKFACSRPKIYSRKFSYFTTSSCRNMATSCGEVPMRQ